jgi:Gpi18-like mannosyltransferase
MAVLESFWKKIYRFAMFASTQATITLSRRLLRAVIFPFLLSRAVVLTILILIPLLTLLAPTSDGVRAVAFSHGGLKSAAAISNALLAGDAVHYRDIAQHGYLKPMSRGWFPLFPLVWRFFAAITGEYPFTGCVLSNAFFLIGLMLLYKTIGLLGYSECVASRTVLYLTIFPTSHFFSLPLTESLFLVLTVGAFYKALTSHWMIAGILGALASATRLAGLLLLPSLLLLLYLQRSASIRKRDLVSLLLIPCGTLAFFSYLYLTTGDFFAYGTTQMSFSVHPQAFFLLPLIRYALHPTMFHEWAFFPLQFVMTVLGFGCCWMLAKHRQWVLALYLFGSIVLPLSAGLFGYMTRFLMVSFPLAIVLGEAGESSIVDQTIRVVFVSLLTLMTLACAAKFGLGMA